MTIRGVLPGTFDTVRFYSSLPRFAKCTCLRIEIFPFSETGMQLVQFEHRDILAYNMNIEDESVEQRHFLRGSIQGAIAQGHRSVDRQHIFTCTYIDAVPLFRSVYRGR